MQQFVACAKANADKMQFASAGTARNGRLNALSPFMHHPNIIPIFRNYP
ncbi:hypothetical protein [Bradyrhizobium sp.]